MNEPNVAMLEFNAATPVSSGGSGVLNYTIYLKEESWQPGACSTKSCVVFIRL